VNQSKNGGSTFLNLSGHGPARPPGNLFYPQGTPMQSIVMVVGVWLST
jgi:hypothetical protein